MLRAIRSGFISLGLLSFGLLAGAAELQRFELASAYLKAPVLVEVLVPDGADAGSRLPVVYVLAAEPRPDGNRGLAEIQRLGLADKHHVLCVGVNFDTMPWYGDHATDPGIRHESHIVRCLVPEIDRRYPTQAARDGRWLLGFSKSGWGACTLLFRNPETFGYAASWDAPLLFTQADFGTYLTAPHFGTAENFARYLPAELARSHAAQFRDRPRLVLAGSALFGGEPDKRFAATPHTETMHRLLDELGIPHGYDPHLTFRHAWNSGWLEPTLAHLAEIARADAQIATSVNLSNTATLAHSPPDRTLDFPAMSVPYPALNYYRPMASARPPQRTEGDVVIYGATSAGVIAAIQLVQLGRRVTLLEFGGHVGGVTASGLGATDIGNKRAIGGLARDFYRRLGKHYGRDESWTFEPKIAESTFRAWLAEAGVTVHFFQRLAGVTTVDGAIRELRTESGDVWTGKIFIDATYEGDLLAAAGVSYHVGREGNARYGEIHNGVAWGHPGHNFKLAVDPYIVPGQPESGLLPGVFPGGGGKEGEGDSRVQAYNFRLCLTQAADRVPFPQPAGYDPQRYEVLRRYIDAGMWDVLRLTTAMPNGKTDTNNFGAFSSDNIGMNHAWPEADYATRERIFQDHVTYHQGLMWFLAHDPRLPARVREEVSAWGLPRDEFPETGHWPHQLYVREARRMVSDYVMTENDCVRARACSDPVGLAAYTMDSHACNRVVRGGRVYNEGLVEMGGFPPYGISYRSIVPRRDECRNLLVPVCLAASHIAYGSIRMEPVFMVLAQSAALAAHLALTSGGAVQDVPYAALRAQLLAAGQMLEWKHDPFAPPEAKNP